MPECARLRLDTSWAGAWGVGRRFGTGHKARIAAQWEGRSGSSRTDEAAAAVRPPGYRRDSVGSMGDRRDTAEIPSGPIGDVAAGALGSAADQKQNYEGRGARRLGERARRREVSTRGRSRAHGACHVCAAVHVKRRVREFAAPAVSDKANPQRVERMVRTCRLACCCEERFCRVEYRERDRRFRSSRLPEVCAAHAYGARPRAHHRIQNSGTARRVVYFGCTENHCFHN